MAELWSHVLATAFFFVEGLLAGFALMLLIVIYTNSKISFLHFYSPIALLCSRIFYWATGFCILGAVDKLGKGLITEWTEEPNRTETVGHVVLDVMTLAVYLFSFLLTMMVSTFDERLHYANSRVAEWYSGGEEALTTEFEDDLTLYHVCGTIRNCLVIFGFATLLAGTSKRAAVSRRNDLAEQVLSFGRFPRGPFHNMVRPRRRQ